MRQPFLKHISGDDFLTAYLGYDDSQCLDRLRLSSLVIINFIIAGFKSIVWGTLYFVTKVIIEVLSLRHFERKMIDFWRMMFHEKPRPDLIVSNFMERVSSIAKSTSHVDDVILRHRSRAITSLFMNNVSSRRG